MSEPTNRELAEMLKDCIETLESYDLSYTSRIVWLAASRLDRTVPREPIAMLGTYDGIVAYVEALFIANKEIIRLRETAKDAAKSIRRVLDMNPDAYRHGQAELLAAAQWLDASPTRADNRKE